MNTNSQFFKLSWTDLLHGLVVAIFGSILTGILKLFQAGSTLSWVTIQPVLIVGISAGLAYLASQLVTNSQNQLFQSENSPEVLKAKEQSKKLGVPYGKVVLIILLLSIGGMTLSAQGLLHKVTSSIFTIDQKTLSLGKTLLLSNGTSILSGKWEVRLDATICPQTAFNWDASIKQFVPTTLSSVGPGIGFKHYVPTSVTDPTPFENYGFSAAVMFGANIYHPDLSKIELAQEADILQYIKFGITETLNTKNWFGFFIGSGITF